MISLMYLGIISTSLEVFFRLQRKADPMSNILMEKEKELSDSSSLDSILRLNQEQQYL